MWITLKKRKKAGCLFFFFFFSSPLARYSNHTRSLEWQGNSSHNYVHKMLTDFFFLKILNWFAVRLSPTGKPKWWTQTPCRRRKRRPFNIYQPHELMIALSPLSQGFSLLLQSSEEARHRPQPTSPPPAILHRENSQEKRPLSTARNEAAWSIH